MVVFWGVPRSFFFEECPRSRSCLAVMKGLANALTPPPKGREGRTPLGERDGLPVVHPVRCRLPTHKSLANQVLNSYTTQSVKQHYSEVIEGIGTVYACTRSNIKKENDRELCVTFW